MRMIMRHDQMEFYDHFEGSRIYLGRPAGGRAATLRAQSAHFSEYLGRTKQQLLELVSTTTRRSFESKDHSENERRS
jgi:hypothetical protein